jgi:hypothetical protein
MKKKIRGHKRISRQIEKWRTENLYPNVDLIKKNSTGRSIRYDLLYVERPLDTI